MSVVQWVWSNECGPNSMVPWVWLHECGPMSVVPWVSIHDHSSFRVVPWVGCYRCGTNSVVPSVWYQEYGTKSMVPKVWYQECGTKSVVSWIWYDDLQVAPSLWSHQFVPVSGLHLYGPSVWSSQVHCGTSTVRGSVRSLTWQRADQQLIRSFPDHQVYENIVHKTPQIDEQVAHEMLINPSYIANELFLPMLLT